MVRDHFMTILWRSLEMVRDHDYSLEMVRDRFMIYLRDGP